MTVRNDADIVLNHISLMALLPPRVLARIVRFAPIEQRSDHHRGIAIWLQAE